MTGGDKQEIYSVQGFNVLVKILFSSFYLTIYAVLSFLFVIFLSSWMFSANLVGVE